MLPVRARAAFASPFPDGFLRANDNDAGGGVPDEASGSALLGSAAGALKCSSIVDRWLNSESSEDEVGPPSGPWPWGVRGDARAPA